jgi:ABC-type transport system substrate-binding protein
MVLVGTLVCAACTTALPPQAIVPSPAAPPPPVAEPHQLVFAVDDLGQGFNPHLMSDLSPVSAAVASLVLPSVFRPAPDGSMVLDTTVASSVQVVSNAPFTVSYELALGASWSDNTPIAAEDFVYLWERMRREPGVVDAAGYRTITDVRSRAGGKAVDVVFAQRYPQWQRLFADLLPAHLLKDSPRSWSAALADSIPVSGGPFSVSAVDRDRGQLVLARNDHYWATPAVLDSLVLRRIDPVAMLDGLRNGELPVAQAWPDQTVLAGLRQLATPTPVTPPGTPVPPPGKLPGKLKPAPPVPMRPAAIRLQPVAQPVVVQLGLRTDAGIFADERLRRAVAAMLDRDALIGVGTGNGAAGVRVDSQLLAPTTPGYRPTIPPGAPASPEPKLAEQLLTAAGYQRDQQAKWTLAGAPLRVTVGAPAANTRFLAIASEVVRQLVAAGVDAQLATAPGSVLYSEPTLPAPLPSQASSSTPEPGPGSSTPAVSGTSGTPPSAPPTPSVTPTAVPAAVAPRGPGAAAPGVAAAGLGPAAGPDGASSAVPSTPGASPTRAPDPIVTGVRVDLEVQPRAVGGDLATEAVSAYGCPPGMAGVDQPARNPTGFCSAQLQPLLDAVLGSGLTPEQAVATVEPVLWRELPAIPLFQAVTTLASTPGGDLATGNISPGPLSVGPLGTAATWRPVNG